MKKLFSPSDPDGEVKVPISKFLSVGVVGFLCFVITSTVVLADMELTRLPATTVAGGYTPSYPDTPLSNFNDGDYSTQWYAAGPELTTYLYPAVSYVFDRLYTVNTLKYGGNSDGRTTTFAVTAGNGPKLSYNNTSEIGNPVIPMTATLGRMTGMVTWEVTGSTDNTYVGGTDFELFGAATDYMRLANPAILNSATPYDSDYAAAKVFDGRTHAQVSGITEYATAGAGADAYIVFDLVASGGNVGFVEIIDRPTDCVNGAELIFSNDPTFSSGNTIFAYSGIGGGSVLVNVGADTGGASQRYMKWQVTDAAAGANTGALEFAFYSAVPEPGTLVTLATGLIGLLTYGWRKRK